MEAIVIFGKVVGYLPHNIFLDRSHYSVELFGERFLDDGHDLAGAGLEFSLNCTTYIFIVVFRRLHLIKGSQVAVTLTHPVWLDDISFLKCIGKLLLT